MLGTKGPRKMTLLIPKLEAGGQRPLALSPRGEHDTLLGRCVASWLAGRLAGLLMVAVSFAGRGHGLARQWLPLSGLF